MMNSRACFAALIATGMSFNAMASTCSAEAGPARRALVELYTSEGCDSCPPADRWLSALVNQRGLSGRAVALAFHVDYWDYIGWPDRFADPAYSQRQRESVAKQRSRTVFTPQVMVNGRTLQAWSSDRFADALDQINADKSGATLKISATRVDARRWRLVASGTTPRQGSELYLALFEDRLSSEVARGENAGKRLAHDRVVRKLLGPLPLVKGNPFEQSRELELPGDAKANDVGFAAFIQSAQDGDVLQAVDLRACPS